MTSPRQRAARRLGVVVVPRLTPVERIVLTLAQDADPIMRSRLFATVPGGVGSVVSNTLVLEPSLWCGLYVGLLPYRGRPKRRLRRAFVRARNRLVALGLLHDQVEGRVTPLRRPVLGTPETVRRWVFMLDIDSKRKRMR